MHSYCRNADLLILLRISSRIAEKHDTQYLLDWNSIKIVNSG
jgi:hypothetical protein